MLLASPDKRCDPPPSRRPNTPSTSVSQPQSARSPSASTAGTLFGGAADITFAVGIAVGMFTLTGQVTVALNIQAEAQESANTRILLHFTQFQLRWQKVYQPYGAWEHFPSSISCDEEAPPLEPDSDDTYLCQLCAHKETSQCCQSHLFLCNKCMANHSFDLQDDEP